MTMKSLIAIFSCPPEPDGSQNDFAFENNFFLNTQREFSENLDSERSDTDWVEPAAQIANPHSLRSKGGFKALPLKVNS